MHPDPPSAARIAEWLGRYRVVEVARAGGVDREGGQITQIAPAAPDVHTLTGARCGAPGLALDRGVEPARVTAVDQQRVEHVARDIRTPQLAHDPRPALATPSRRRHQHQAADRCLWALYGDPAPT